MAIYSSSQWAPEDCRIDDLVAFKDKIKAPYLVCNMDASIAALVRRNDRDLEVSQRYMEGERDSREFAVLTENFGIGNPRELPFIPLMNRHIKALVGTFMEMPFPFTVSATDHDSIELAREEWANQVRREVAHLINQAAQQWGQDIAAAAGGGAQQPQQGGQNMEMTISERALAEINDQGETFQTTLERYASVLMEGLIDRMHLKDEMAQFVEDHCAYGRIHYRAWIDEVTQLPKFEIIAPGELHFLRGKSHGDIRTHKRVVRHRRRPRTDALADYASLMSKEERDMVAGVKGGAGLEGVDWVPLRQGEERYMDEVAVRRAGMTKGDVTGMIDEYHVEWLAVSEVDAWEDGTPFSTHQLQGQNGTLTLTREEEKRMNSNRTRFVMHRYEGIKLGSGTSGIYLQMGRTRNVPRSVDDEFTCYLSYNGVDSGRSLLRQTKDLQDKYDILSYHQDNLIAMGGVPGVMVDINDIPTYLDPKNIGNRVAKWKAHLKQGLALVDRNQLGSNGSGTGQPTDARQMFNNAGNIDTSFNGQSVTAIREQLAHIEELATRISGVPRQMQGDIEERDGLGTTQQAMASATKVNRPMFALVYRMCQQACTDLLNLCRLTAEYNPAALLSIIGSVGARMLGAGNKHFALADLAVVFRDAIQEQEKLERLRMAGQQLIEQTLLDADAIIDIATVNTTAQLRYKLRAGTKRKAKDQTAQLQQQNEQMQKELQTAQAAVDQFKQGELQVKQQQVQVTQALGQDANSIKREQLALDADMNRQELALEAKRVDLEQDQVYFNKQSMEVADE